MAPADERSAWSGNHHVPVFIVWFITYVSGQASAHLCGLVIIPRPVPSLVESIVKAQFQDNWTVMQRVDSMKYLVGDAGRYFMSHRGESVFNYILLSLSPLRWCRSFSKCQRTAQTTNTHTGTEQLRRRASTPAPFHFAVSRGYTLCMPLPRDEGNCAGRAATLSITRVTYSGLVKLPAPVFRTFY